MVTGRPRPFCGDKGQTPPVWPPWQGHPWGTATRTSSPSATHPGGPQDPGSLRDSGSARDPGISSGDPHPCPPNSYLPASPTRAPPLPTPPGRSGCAGIAGAAPGLGDRARNQQRDQDPPAISMGSTPFPWIHPIPWDPPHSRCGGCTGSTGDPDTAQLHRGWADPGFLLPCWDPKGSHRIPWDRPVPTRHATSAPDPKARVGFPLLPRSQGHQSRPEGPG